MRKKGGEKRRYTVVDGTIEAQNHKMYAIMYPATEEAEV
jgi:hypothetical protein